METTGRLMENHWKTNAKPMESQWKTIGKPEENQWKTCGKPRPQEFFGIDFTTKAFHCDQKRCAFPVGPGRLGVWAQSEILGTDGWMIFL